MALRDLIGKQVIVALIFLLIVVSGTLYVDDFINEKVNTIKITGGVILDFSDLSNIPLQNGTQEKTIK